MTRDDIAVAVYELPLGQSNKFRGATRKKRYAMVCQETAKSVTEELEFDFIDMVSMVRAKAMSDTAARTKNRRRPS